MAGLNLTQGAKPAPELKEEKIESISEVTETTEGVEDAEEFVYYTSTPIEQFGIGKYKFKNKQLKIPKSEEAEFDARIARSDPRTRQVVKKIDVNKANAFVAARKAVATKQIDSASPENNAKTLMATKPIELGSEV